MRKNLLRKFAIELFKSSLALLLAWGVRLLKICNVNLSNLLLLFFLLFDSKLSFLSNQELSRNQLFMVHIYWLLLFFVLPNIETIRILGVAGARIFVGADRETFCSFSLLCFASCIVLGHQLLQVKQISISIVVAILVEEILLPRIRVVSQKCYDDLFYNLWWQ